MILFCLHSLHCSEVLARHFFAYFEHKWFPAALSAFFCIVSQFYIHEIDDHGTTAVDKEIILLIKKHKCRLSNIVFRGD